MKAVKYGKEKLYFTIGTYNYGGNLYVGMVNDKGEDFCDLSVNIPTYMLETDEEIIINGDISNELVEVLEDLGILIDTYKMAFSGFGRYKVMIFNEEMAKDYIKIDYRNEE